MNNLNYHCRVFIRVFQGKKMPPLFFFFFPLLDSFHFCLISFMCCIGCFLAIWISFLEQWDVWGLRGQWKNTALVVHSVTWHWLMRVRTWAEFDRERRGNWRTWGHQKEEGKEMTREDQKGGSDCTASGGSHPTQGHPQPEIQNGGETLPRQERVPSQWWGHFREHLTPLQVYPAQQDLLCQHNPSSCEHLPQKCHKKHLPLFFPLFLRLHPVGLTPKLELTEFTTFLKEPKTLCWNNPELQTLWMQGRDGLVALWRENCSFRWMSLIFHVNKSEVMLVRKEFLINQRCFRKVGSLVWFLTDIF